MSPDDAKAIFLDAIEHHDPDHWESFVSSRCAANDEVRERVLLLLKSYSDPASLVAESGLHQAGDSNELAVETGIMIGPYVIREKIGEGGMGVVYVAEQFEPVQRKVAIKIIKPGMDTNEVIARFEAERQALAFMEHPNIARVLDAGATESGRSYFVMELVRGVPITEYCDQVKASPCERIQLFQTVCDAAQHAHQKGIIHRDLKPSNVLVTQIGTKPVVKVIDFGLAKAISGQRLTEKTLYTGFMKLMGTPAYMSPEQAGMSGLDIDTRSDIYSLGVLLYELLTGTTPLDKTEIQQQAFDELCRQIREQDAPKPSTRFSTLKDAERTTIAQHRQIESRELRQLLDGDLDRVVLKAIEKDRERRYASPQELSADLQRFLADKPVLAVPPSQWYLARKYMRRNKAFIITAVTIFLCLVLSSAISSWQAIRATAAGNIAQEKSIAAEHSEQQALAAERNANRARQKAVKSEQQSKQAAEERRRLLYAANMQLADQLWNGHHGNAQEIHNLLVNWIPFDSDLEDLRGFAWRHQWTRLHYGSAQTVRDTDAVSISPNGHLLISDQHGVREWDENSRQFVVRLSPDAIHNGEQISLSPCGRWAALMPRSLSDELSADKVRLVDLNSGDVVRTAPGNQAMFSRNGRIVFIWDGRAELGRMSQFGQQSEQHLANHEVLDLSTRRKVETQEGLSWLLSSTNQANSGSISQDGESFIFSSGSDLMAHLPNGPFATQYEFYVMVTAFSPDGQLMADGQDGGDVYVRLTNNPDSALVLNAPHVEGVSSLMFSHDSRLLAVGDHDGTVSIWDISEVYNLENQNKRADVRSSDDELPIVRRAETSKIVRSLKGHLRDVSTVIFSPDGKKLLSRDSGGTAKLWNLAREAARSQVTSQAEDRYGSSTGILLESTSGGVRVSSVHPGFQEIVEGSIHVGDRVVGVTNESGHHEIGPNPDQEAEEIDSIYRLLAGTHNSTVEIHLESGQQRQTAKLKRKFVRVPMATALTYSADGTSIFVADYTKGAVALTASGRPRRRFPILNSSLALSPNGNLLAMDNFNELVLWDLREDEPYAQWDARVDATPLPFTAWGGSLAFSPDGKYVAMGTGLRGNAVAKRSDLMVWEVATGNVIGGMPLFAGDNIISCLDFSPNGESLIVGSHDGFVRIWNTATWELERTYDFPVAALQSMAISPDGNTAAVAGDGTSLVIWDFESGRTLHAIRDLSAKALDFSADGKTLVAAGFHKKVVLLDTLTGQRVGSLLGHVQGIMGCEFSPDERTLATVDYLGDLRLWNAKLLSEIDQDAIALKAAYDRAVVMINEKRHAAAEKMLRRVLSIERESLSPDLSLVEAAEKLLVRALKAQKQFPSIVKQPTSMRVRPGESVTLSVEVSNNSALDVTYQWFLSGESLDGATASTLPIPSVSDRDLGRYHIEVGFPELPSVVLQSEGAVLVGSNGIVKGGLKKDLFLNIAHSKSRSLSPLTDSPKFPHQPDVTGSIGNFELPVDFGDEYGVRIHGFVIPPKSGDYVFYLVSDDSSELYLSTDASPDNKTMIASLTGYNVNQRGWQTLRPDNISSPITLQADKRYWIEALFREKMIGDHLSVTWQMPGEPPPKNGDPPIPAKFLGFQLE